MITSAFALVCFTNTSELSAKDAFVQTLNNYAKLESFSADLEQDNSSGLFSGKYHQHLEFKKGKGFKLVVTGLKEARPDNVAPDYYCDGDDVSIKGRNDRVDPINKDKNIAPGYEVSGGVVMSWLLDSPMKVMFTKPPEGFDLQFSWGKRTEWKGIKVKEVVMTRKIGGRSTSACYFIAPDHKHLVGFEWTRDGKTGILEYKNQKDNPKIDAKDLKPPVN
ncbi:MAG: hypothetical protein WCG75_04255 [Armatimonadota bacterium]